MSDVEPRVLLAGYGAIGKEIYADHSQRLPGLMITDPNQFVPVEHLWDRNRVDLTEIAVDTPGRNGHYDYRHLEAALRQYLPASGHLVIRSTVGLDFLDHDLYRDHATRIGFSPEFYGTTEHSRRGQVPMGFSLYSDNVPAWYISTVTDGTAITGKPAEVILAKLAENAYLATKVTFFHELWTLCDRAGLDFDTVREMVTADPRINPYHSHCDGKPGWSSHCWDKDVPVYAGLTSGGLVEQVLKINNALTCYTY